MPPVGFEPTTPAGERLQTYALDRAATGSGNENQYLSKYNQTVLYLLHTTTCFELS